MSTTNNESSKSNNVLQKVGLLLEKTRDALIADLQQEFIGVRTAAQKFEQEQSAANFVPIIDAVFAKVGYDISHYEELNEVRTVVERLLTVTDKIADTVKDASKINDDGKIEADEIAKVASDVMPLVQEVVELVKAVSDIEWKAVAEDLSKSGKDMGEKIMNDIFTKDFARKVLDHILMTLLKNAKVVFKDEIEFAKFTIESGINQLVTDADKMAEAIKRGVLNEVTEDVNIIKHTMQETLADATSLYEQIRQQVGEDVKDWQALANEYQATYVKIANGLSIAYSILEFLGIVEEKKITLQLPDGLKEAIGKIQKASNDVAGKIGDAVDTVSPIVSDAISTVVDTMDDAMKTTRDITGIGVASAGKIDLQLQSVEKFMNGTTTDIASGLSIVADALGNVVGKGSDLKAGVNNVAEKINGALQTAIDYRYPITINVISWEKVEDLFTNPIDHFKALYPIDSMADVESLMTKIMDILHRINSDIPDFSSLKKLLEDLLRKLQRMVMKKINELKAKLKEAVGKVKTEIETAIRKIWDWFQPVVTTIRNVIRMLKELALQLKDRMKEILEEVKDGAMLIATDLQNDFNRVKNELEAGVNEAVSTVKKGVENVAADARKKIYEISTDASAFINGIEDAADDAVKEVTKVADSIVNKTKKDFENAVKDLDEAAKKKAEDMQKVWLEIQKDMPKMPKLNLPKVVRTTLVEPMANCVKDTLKESLEIDLSSVVDFSQQRNELVACVKALKKDYGRLRSHDLSKLKIGLNESDFNAVLNINFEKDWSAAYQLPDIPKIVQEIVVPDLQAWAYGMVSSIQALIDPKAWMTRFEALATQLKTEFQNDLSNITGLISKEGAMRLLDDASAVKKDLKEQLNITDYINILETSVNDVVLPDPEYYYSSFKQCILGIITKLTARIIEEANKIKKNVAQIKNNLKSIPDQIKSNVSNLLGKLEEAKNKLAGELDKSYDEAKEAVLQFVEDLKATAKAIKNIVEKIPETIDNLVDYFTNKFSSTISALGTNIKNKAEEILKKIADAFIDKLEDLAAEMWNKLKNEYIIPMLKAIKRKIIYFVKHVIREEVRELINAITDLNGDPSSLLGNNTFFNNLHEAQVNIAKSLKPVIVNLKESNPEIKQLLGDNTTITNMNQLPAVIKAIEKSSKNDIQNVFEKLTINIQFDENMPGVKVPDIIVPYYYVTWVQGTLSATVEFVQSDMGLKEIIILVQALYKSVPEEIKQQVADVLPSLPSLPSNGFTDLLNDVTCSYDLDNMMANVTLLDLKAKDDNGGSVAWDTSLKLQLFIMAGLYSKDGFVEKKKEDDSEEKDKEEGAKDQGGSTGNDEAKEEEDNTVPAIFFTIMLQGKVLLTFKLGDKHYITLNGTGSVGAEKLSNETKDVSVGFCISKKDSEKGITSRFHAFGSTKSLGAMLSGEFSRNKEVGPANVIETKYLDVRIGNYPIGLYVLYNEAYPKFNFGGGEVNVAKFLGAPETGRVDGFTAGAYGAVKDFEVVLKLRENDFFRSFLKDDISAKFDLALAYDYIKGFKMDGGYTFHIDIDCNNKKIGPIDLSNISVDLGCVKGDLGTLQFSVAPTFDIKFGDCVTMSFEKLGLGASVNIVKKDDKGKLGLGDFDFDFKFKFPEGIGIAINCDVVNGAALIGYDEEKKELFGAMELSVLEKFGVGAMLIMTFGDNFSMVAMLSVRFSPGIPLGMGFSLTAIGGMLGLNRMLDYDAIRESVRNGSLASVFFVEDVMKHIGDMRKAAEKIFPAKRDQFFVGLLGQISYEPVVKCSFGLMFQAPDPLSIIIVGDLKVAIEGADVIRINVAFSGEIDFNKGLQFDAALYDSEIVGIRLEGDMAFRLFWGGPVKGFLMSVGGFHPAYKPEEAMHVSDMRRLAMKLDYDVLKVGLETYLAITSNTFQIGAHLDIKVGWDKFGIIGYAGFDALFQFDPFMFMFDIEAGMAVMIGSSRLMSIDLALALSGPRPWHAKGKAKFYFLFIPINVGFDVTWGNKQQSLPNKQIEVLKLLEEQINNLSNWSVDENSRRDSDVILLNEEKDGKEKKLVLSPNGVLTFSQSAIPLEMKMQLCDNAVPTDCNEVMIDKVVINGNTYEIINKSTDEAKDTTLTQCAIGETINADFAPALYLQMDNDEKLKSPSYVQYASGFTMKNGNDRMVGGSKTHDLGKIEQFIRGVEKSDRTFAGTSTGGRVAYPKTDMVSVERYVNILDTIQSEK